MLTIQKGLLLPVAIEPTQPNLSGPLAEVSGFLHLAFSEAQRPTDNVGKVVPFGLTRIQVVVANSSPSSVVKDFDSPGGDGDLTVAASLHCSIESNQTPNPR